MHCLQAVVNEHTDIRVINAELVAALDKRDDKSHLLEATLLAKEEELESLSRGQKVGSIYSHLILVMATFDNIIVMWNLSKHAITLC